jgi:putative ABC transport system ATP-binding protein/lipoprotein-releasing system ATP-binding protein
VSIHLEARNLGRSFFLSGKRLDVLRGVQFSICKGESVFICGASGAGKTTLLYTLAGLETPQEGEVFFEGKSIYRMGRDRLSALRNARMGFVFQSYFLLPELTALENVLLPAMIGKSDREDRARWLLERVGLAERMQHLPNELSGGEQQRVAIARALVNDPSILFADEPTGNLDSRTGASIVELLLELVAEGARTLVVVTHDPELAKRGNRILRVRDGSVFEEGTTAS